MCVVQIYFLPEVEVKIHHKLLIALVLGALLGVALHGGQLPLVININDNFLAPIGQAFLRLIFMVVVPMVFSGLVLGVYQLGEHQGLGKVAGKTLLYTIIASGLSVFIGIAMVNTFEPGKGLQIPTELLGDQSPSVLKIQMNASSAKTVAQSLIEIIPKNPLDSAVKAFDGEMLSLMFFALFFGHALGQINRQRKNNIFINCLEQIYEVCMSIVNTVMKLSPYAVFALVFNTTFKFGHSLLISLLYYVAVVVVALCVQQFIVYALMLKFLAKRSPWKFFNDCREVYIYAFATASSNATLPKSLELAENKLKLHPAISRFVLTVGSTANQNGTALFEGITVLFLAQVYSIDLSFGQQVQVVLMSILAGIGTAGVPGGSLPLIMILLIQMGIPVEGMGIILGVDRFLDMCRTTLNVSGDLVIAALVNDTAIDGPSKELA